MRPFNLGSAFQVSAATMAGPVSSAGGVVCEDNCPNGEVKVAFSLLEANGTTPVPFSVTLEPSTGSLLLCALFAAAYRFRRRSQALFHS